MTAPRRFSVDVDRLRKERDTAWRVLDDVPPPRPDSPAGEFVRTLRDAERKVIADAEADARAAAERARTDPLESTIKSRVTKALEARGWTVMRRGVGVVKEHGRILFSYGVAGEADLEVLCPGGVAVFIELKRAGERPTTAQVAFLEKRRAQGFVADVARSPEEAVALCEQALGRRRL